MKIWPWLYLALRLKRWLLLALLGIILFGLGLAFALERHLSDFFDGIPSLWLIGIICIVCGVGLALLSFSRIGRLLLQSSADEARGKVRNLYQRQYLRRGPRIVVIGGGTGLSVLLRGLKEYTSNLTAIVSVADDGGSSGRLRDQFGILPPGDLRNCLVALADTEPVMESLFNYRFHCGEGLEGHNLGNLLITALTDLSGNMETAINQISKVLAIRGRVLPATLDNVVLAAELSDGSTLKGETVVSKTDKPINKAFLIPENCSPLPEALEALNEADAIILGPGSLYTSVIPNLLVPGIVEAIQKSTALKIYVCNVMTQYGETRDYTAADHLQALYRHSAPDLVDYIVVNDQDVPEPYRERYAAEGAVPVEIDRVRLQKMNVKIVAAPLIRQGDYIRHDSQKLAGQIVNLILGKRNSAPFNLVDHFIMWNKVTRNM